MFFVCREFQELRFSWLSLYDKSAMIGFKYFIAPFTQKLRDREGSIAFNWFFSRTINTLSLSLELFLSLETWFLQHRFYFYMEKKKGEIVKIGFLLFSPSIIRPLICYIYNLSIHLPPVISLRKNPDPSIDSI